MKIKPILLAALLGAGGIASFAVAKPPKLPSAGTQTTGTTSTTASGKPKCNQVELKGNATAGSVTFTVTKANKRGRNLVGTQVTLSVPAGAKVKAKACNSGSGLTLRDLHVTVAPAKP